MADGKQLKTWSAWVTKTERYRVTVRAETWGEARDAAEAVPPDGSAAVTFRADNLVQVGEPWAYSDGWYDLHGPGDLIVIQRAPGNAFSEADIKLLRARLHGLDLVVIDSWNGAGCGTVSFICSGRKRNAQLSESQIVQLLAPRQTLTRATHTEQTQTEPGPRAEPGGSPKG